MPGGRHLNAEQRELEAQQQRRSTHAPVAVPHCDSHRPPPPAAHYRAARLDTGAPAPAPSSRGAASASAQTDDEKELKSTRQQPWTWHQSPDDVHAHSNSGLTSSGSPHSLAHPCDQTPALHRDFHLSQSSRNVARPIARRSASTPLDVDVERYQSAPVLKLIPSADSSATILVDAPSRTDTPHPPGFMHTQENSDATTRAAFSNGNGLAADNIQPLHPGGMGNSSPNYAHDSIGKRSALSASSSEGGSAYANEFSHPPRVFSDYDINTPASVTHGSGVSEGGRVKRKRKPAPPELLVIVRPPPSKDRNPLNLQIQLVVPQAPPAASRVSGESTRDSASTPALRPGGELKRRGSSSSTRSGVSVVTNASSASSTGGGGRKVTPLYNLSFHTILPSTVSDAGTDQKVAKYSRKGVDVDGFGVLEPHELVRGLNDLSTLEAAEVGSRSPTQESQDGSLLSPKLPGSDPGIEPPSDSSSEPPTSYEAMTPEAKNEKGMGARFMRRFKGLSVGSAKSLIDSSVSAGAPPSIVAGGTTTTGANSGFGSFLSGIGNSARSVRTATVDSVRPASSAGPHSITIPAARSSGSVAVSVAPSAPTVAGGAGSSDVAPLVAGAGLSDGSRRTRGYYWTIKKLTRRVTDEHGNLPEIPFGPDGQNPVLRNVWRRFNAVNRMGGDEAHPHPSEVPVRFEWTRETRGSDAKSSNGRSGRSVHQRAATDAQAIVARKRMSVASTGTGTTRSSFDDGRSASGRAGGGQPTSLRPGGGGLSRDASNGNLLSPSPRMSSESSALAAATGGEEVRSSYDLSQDFQQDVEDDGNDSDPEDSETPWSCHLVLGGNTRIPIGTLSPAPHHPKVVAQLAVPFPLPDLSQTGLGYDRAGLTREEIKDIICVTCLHLVIRESFGGLGRVAARKDKR